VGTLLGIGLGIFAVRWIVSGFDSVMPDLSIDSTLSGGSVALTMVLGVLVVALAPLLNYRKQRRMDIPSTLRVVE
jgi:putative ABC transport system permease protein